MVGILFDTCILIDYLRGVSAARDEIEAQNGAAISIVSWMEVLAGAPDGADEATRSFLSRFDMVEIDPAIADAAVTIRRDRRLKLPDAIIAASAEATRRVLVTRDGKAFGPERPGVRFPYRL
jgi:predicted nucleic acid-binding protein